MQEYSEDLTVKEKVLQQLQSESIHLRWKEESEHYCPDRDGADSRITEKWKQVYNYIM